MKKITSFLWFDNQAEKASGFYTSVFSKFGKGSKILNVARYPKAAEKVSGKKAGSVMTVSFMLNGENFVALNGGPVFKFSPAISFSVSCKTEKEINELWKKLSKGGKIMMPFQKYPWSDKYGWLSDNYGISWQLNLTRDTREITPSLLFVGKQNGKAEKAISFYTSVFKKSKVGRIERYEKEEGDTMGNIKYSDFKLAGQKFIAMESGLNHQFTFTPAISFVVNCKDQKSVDYFWRKLSAVKEAEQCGWLQDKYGVSWQIVPTVLEKLMSNKNSKKVEKVTAAMLKMKKLDIKKLKEAGK